MANIKKYGKYKKNMANIKNMVDIQNIQKCGNMEIMENILNDKNMKNYLKQKNEEKKSNIKIVEEFDIPIESLDCPDKIYTCQHLRFLKGTAKLTWLNKRLFRNKNLYSYTLTSLSYF